MRASVVPVTTSVAYKMHTNCTSDLRVMLSQPYNDEESNPLQSMPRSHTLTEQFLEPTLLVGVPSTPILIHFQLIFVLKILLQGRNGTNSYTFRDLMSWANYSVTICSGMSPRTPPANESSCTCGGLKYVPGGPVFQRTLPEGMI